MIDVLLPISTFTEWTAKAIRSIQIASTDLKVRMLLIVNSSNASDHHDTEVFSKSIDTVPVEILHIKEPNLVSALNMGLEFSTAQLIARMDGDDICLPHRLLLQSKYLLRNPDIGLVGGNAFVCDSRDKQIGRTYLPTKPNEIRQLLKIGNCFVHPSIMFRRNIVQSLGGYRHTFPYAEDMDLYVRMATVTNLANVADPVLVYRQHESQVSTRHLNEQIKATARILVSATHKLENSDELVDQLAPDNSKGIIETVAIPYLRCLFKNPKGVSLFCEITIVRIRRETELSRHRRRKSYALIFVIALLGGPKVMRSAYMLGKVKVSYWLKKNLLRRSSNST